MHIIDDLERPIRYIPISGPGVDALERRKEDNNNKQVTGAEFRDNFKAIRAELMDGLRALIQSR